eukprot:7754434-Lingulodinium_polyedra.AAC.1
MAAQPYPFTARKRGFGNSNTLQRDVHTTRTFGWVVNANMSIARIGLATRRNVRAIDKTL